MAWTNRPALVGTPNMVVYGTFIFLPIKSLVSLYIAGEPIMMKVRTVKSTNWILTGSIVNYIQYFFVRIMFYFFIIVFNR